MIKKNVFDIMPLIELGIAILYWILKDHTLTGIVSTLVAFDVVFAIIWNMRITFNTMTGEISYLVKR